MEVDLALELTRAQLVNRAAPVELQVDLVLNLSKAATTPTISIRLNDNHLLRATLKVMANSIILATSLATSMVEDGNVLLVFCIVNIPSRSRRRLPSHVSFNVCSVLSPS